VVVGRTLDRFADERDRWVRSSAAVRAATITELLESPSDVDIKDAGLKLRYELDRWHLGFVLALPGGGAGSSTVTLEHLAGELCARLGSRTPILHHIGTRALAGWVGSWSARRVRTLADHSARSPTRRMSRSVRRNTVRPGSGAPTSRRSPPSG